MNIIAYRVASAGLGLTVLSVLRVAWWLWVHYYVPLHARAPRSGEPAWFYLGGPPCSLCPAIGAKGRARAQAEDDCRALHAELPFPPRREPV